ncbi:hypothetical protein OESDEN_05742 [Oesophagostomum dentatum]|uniref:Uncharacterized protein n=1 Tax=Oesophagostomum dentatum TaxID=61180 RepID=A0A0B1T9U0_OESDE|nr:hypothetical protein OESDEN_05742 [Oesophagostomum dentatum]
MENVYKFTTESVAEDTSASAKEDHTPSPPTLLT